MRLIYAPLFSDFHYNSNQCVILSDGASYLRLEGQSNTNSLFAINNAQMHEVFDCFFEAVWENCQDVVITDRDNVLAYIDHIAQQIAMIAEMEIDESEN